MTDCRFSPTYLTARTYLPRLSSCTLLYLSPSVFSSTKGRLPDSRVSEGRSQCNRKHELSHEDFLVHAVLVCVPAKKSRMVDTALITTYEGDRPEDAGSRCCPAFMRNTTDLSVEIKSRRIWRGVDHFFDEGAEIKNAERTLLPDPYFQRAH
jgi:hypothetical protein